jgi:hypothetical protein
MKIAILVPLVLRYCSFQEYTCYSKTSRSFNQFQRLSERSFSSNENEHIKYTLEPKEWLPRKLLKNIHFQGGLPRSRLGASNVPLLQRLLNFLARFIVELFCAGAIFHLTTAIPAFNRLLKSAHKSNFLIAYLVRWSIISLAIRSVLIYSEIAASVPSMSRGEDDNWFLTGSYFVLQESSEAPVAEDGKLSKAKAVEPVQVQIRQVPGNGSCLFHAIAAGILYNDSSSTKQNKKQHPTMSEILQLSSQLRTQAVDVLANGIKHNKELVMQKEETICAAELVSLASQQYEITPDEYLNRMRDEKVWGGGPEIVALANRLGRHIVLLETLHCDSTMSSELSNSLDDSICLKVSARFGSSQLEHDELKSPIYILSSNQRFPECRREARDNHFLAVFPSLPF